MPNRMLSRPSRAARSGHRPIFAGILLQHFRRVIRTGESDSAHRSAVTRFPRCDPGGAGVTMAIRAVVARFRNRMMSAGDDLGHDSMLRMALHCRQGRRRRFTHSRCADSRVPSRSSHLRGVFHETWWSAGFVLAGLLLLPAVWTIADEEIPRIGLLTAAFFVASSIHVKLGGISVHLLLNGAGRRDAWPAGPAGRCRGPVASSRGFSATEDTRHSGSMPPMIGVPALLACALFRLLAGRAAPRAADGPSGPGPSPDSSPSC